MVNRVSVFTPTQGRSQSRRKVGIDKTAKMCYINMVHYKQSPRRKVGEESPNTRRLASRDVKTKG